MQLVAFRSCRLPLLLQGLADLRPGEVESDQGVGEWLDLGCGLVGHCAILAVEQVGTQAAWVHECDLGWFAGEILIRGSP
ncbi:hypothetical protein D3C74_179970 [compost metagenome]